MNRPRRWAWGSAALFVVAASAIVSVPGLPFGGAAGAVDGPISVTVAPADLLGDGQLLTVTIKATPGTKVSAAQIQLCRDGFAYQSAHSPKPSTDFFTGGNNCPLQPVSTSANLFFDVGPSVSTTAPTDAGSISRYRVGTGTQAWTSQIDSSAPDDHLRPGRAL